MKSPNRKIMKRSRSIRHKSPNRKIMKRSRSIRHKSPNRKIKRSRSIRHKSPNRKIMKRSRSIRHKTPNRKIMKRSRSIRHKSPNRKIIRLRGGVNQCQVCGSTQNLVNTNSYMGVYTYNCKPTKKEQLECKKRAADNKAEKKKAEKELLKKQELDKKEKYEKEVILDTEVQNIVKQIERWAEKRKRNLNKKFKSENEFFTRSQSNENILTIANEDLETEKNENIEKINKIASEQIDIIQKESPLYVAYRRGIKESERKEIRKKEREEYDALKDSTSLNLREDKLSEDEFESLKTYKTAYKERSAQSTKTKIDNYVHFGEYFKDNKILVTYSVDSINKQNTDKDTPNAHSLEVHCTTMRLPLPMGPVGNAMRDKFYGHVSVHLYRDNTNFREEYHYGINPNTQSRNTLNPEFWPKDAKILLENDLIRLTYIPNYERYFPEHNSVQKLLLDYYNFCIASCPIRTLGLESQKLQSLRQMTSWGPKTPEDDTEDITIDPFIESLSHDERLTRIQSIGSELQKIRETYSAGKNEQEDLTYKDLLWGRPNKLV